MYKVEVIATWFLTKESVTHKKLQKLCYYAQAWYLTLNDKKSLIDTDFQAWVHGPVSPELYQVYKSYLYNPIPRLSNDETLVKEIIPEDIEFLEKVWNTYGNFSSELLESLSHNEQPWRNARGDIGEFERSINIITKKDMKEFYSRLNDLSCEDKLFDISNYNVEELLESDLPSSISFG